MNKLIATAALGILTTSSFMLGAAPKANAYQVSSQSEQSQLTEQTLVASVVCVTRNDEQYCRDSYGNQYYRDSDGNEYYMDRYGNWVLVTH